MLKYTQIVKFGAFEIRAYRETLDKSGEYYLSLTSAANAVGESAISFRSRIKTQINSGGKRIKAMVSETQVGTINAINIELAMAGWKAAAEAGNTKAEALILALGSSGLTRFFDAAFRIERTESEYVEKFKFNLQEWNAALIEKICYSPQYITPGINPELVYNQLEAVNFRWGMYKDRMMTKEELEKILDTWTKTKIPEMRHELVVGAIAAVRLKLLEESTGQKVAVC